MRVTSRQLSLSEARAFLLQEAAERHVKLEVYSSRHASTQIQAFQAEVSEFKLSTRQGVALRALVQGAWGQSYSENLSEAALTRALDDAVENAELVNAEQGAALQQWPAPPALDLYGEGLSGVTVEQKVNVALELERAAREADARVKSIPYLQYQDADMLVGVANTEGLEREDRQLYAMQFSCPLVSEDGQNKMKEDWQFTREFTQLDPTQTSLRAVEKSLALLGARPTPTGTFPALIDGEALAELLALYSVMFSGKFVEEGKSPLGGRLGEQIVNPLLTLLDDPLRPTGLNSRAFDAEGCPSAPLTLIEAGQLTSFLHNADTAARAGTRSTGHATRHGLQSGVTVGPSNLVMQAGATSPAELQRDFTGVLLTGVSGGHAGANPITGDFSLESEGFWLENGEVAYPLDVFTVAGNILELLSDVEAVGSELHDTYYAVSAPSVRVSKLAVAGGQAKG
ncbi:TldD/PmbA family protein [Deinococcus cavernae]|uniref:TldD/PmbA family protein n=1 Tax=Deinococcus cavernae TaxID=2320857 RepID=A0A418UZZ0_9DEIO|nr:TldD/PmbA family protein [Deinococcus cavernae]RJF69046.1 TldD/PmbA family protein [Deinococcus cavernae]